MLKWENKRDTFAEEQRYYKNTYLEICEVYDEFLEASIFQQWMEHLKYMFHLEVYMVLYMQTTRKRHIPCLIK